MQQYIVPMLIGILICVLGIVNMMGNLSTIHWYHRKRVTEENRAIFGKLMGGGTLATGLGVTVSSAFFLLADVTAYQSFYWVGTAVCLIGVAVGLALMLYATIKYNRGLF